MELSILETFLCVFFTALAVTVVFRKLRLSVILGYLLVGALVGPNALAIAHNSHYAQDLAEFGIVFLMFTVGLEFSLPKLFSLRRAVFLIGGLQVLLTMVITTLIGIMLGMTKLSALTVGSIVAMSSTAIVIKQISDQAELFSPHGMTAVGILLFQDLAVIPLIILIAGLANPYQTSLGSLLLWALTKGVIAILLIFIIGRWLLKPLFYLISRTRTVELFTLTVLLVTLTSAWLTNFFGLSYALGAFLAGLMLAETEFRHQIEIEIRPFRDILLALFFITIGMLANIPQWYHTWMWISLLLFALTIGKLLLIFVIAKLARATSATALRTGILLAQGGEFGFALLTLALSKNILPPDYGQVVLAALVISIALAPILIRFNHAISNLLLPKTTEIDDSTLEEKIIYASKKLKHHVILCGYGRVGQHTARLLEKIHYPYIALDTNADLVRTASLAGEPVSYGDPSHPGILYAAGIEHAKVLVISFYDLRATLRILNLLKQIRPTLPVVLRCRDELELKQLKDYPHTLVIAELYEASLTLSHRLLQFIGIPSHKITNLMEEVRSKDYILLQRIFTHPAEISMADEQVIQNGQMKLVLITEEAYAVHKHLKTLDLKAIPVEVVAIRRGETKLVKPKSNTKLHRHDIVVLHGEPQNLEQAERILLEGPEGL